jgi:chromodomain protein Y
MAAAIERLVICLSNYPKLLVAAVNGVATGLGVTILPLFDIVYANDKAIFNTFFTRLGQIPEGAASVTLPQLCSGLGGPINEMLLFGRVLTASEMVSVGLVTQAFFPGRLMEEVIPRIRRACGENNSGLQWNKLLLKQHQKSQVEQVITGETELLTDMWSSKDFHVNLVNFINTEKCLQFQNPN